MPFLLSWCVKQIKLLLGLINSISASVGSITATSGAGNPTTLGKTGAGFGQWYLDTDTNTKYFWNGTEWV